MPRLKVKVEVIFRLLLAMMHARKQCELTMMQAGCTHDQLAITKRLGKSSLPSIPCQPRAWGPFAKPLSACSRSVHLSTNEWQNLQLMAALDLVVSEKPMDNIFIEKITVSHKFALPITPRGQKRSQAVLPAEVIIRNVTYALTEEYPKQALAVFLGCNASFTSAGVYKPPGSDGNCAQRHAGNLQNFHASRFSFVHAAQRVEPFIAIYSTANG